MRAHGTIPAGLPDILMVGPRPMPPGGITDLVANWRAAGLPDRVRLEEIRLCASGEAAWRQQSQFVAGMYQLARRLASRRKGSALVHAHMSIRGSFYRKLLVCGYARLRGTRYLVQIHSGEFREWVTARPHRRALAHRALGHATSVIVPAERWRLDAADLGARRVEVVDNCIAAGERRALAPRPAPVANAGLPPTILYFGGWRPVKGLDLLGRALRELPPEVDYRLRVFGAGDRRWLQRQLEPLGGLVQIGGWLDLEGKAAELSRAAVFVQPSRAEAFGQTLLEARASGVPIVASDAGAIPEVLEGYERRILFESGSHLALARALQQVLNGGLGRASQGSVPTRYHAEVAIEKLVGVYRRAAAA